MSKLAFLQNIQVVAVEQPRKSSGSRKEWNPPSGLTIRIWRDGSVYPSQALADKFQLEYRKKLTDDELADLKAAQKSRPFPGNGFDVADTNDFPVFQTGGQRLLIISCAEKDAGKVDLFNSVSYGDDNVPKMSVMDQGNNTFGKDLMIPWIEEIYGVVFARPAIPAKVDGHGNVDVAEVPAVEGVEFVDLIFLGQDGENSDPWHLPSGKTIAFFPKRVARGDKKGDMTVVRRENPEIYVLYPKHLLDDATEGTVEDSQASKVGSNG